MRDSRAVRYPRVRGQTGRRKMLIPFDGARPLMADVLHLPFNIGAGDNLSPWGFWSL